MNRLLFEKPMHIDEVKSKYDFDKVAVLTTPNIFPLVKGIEYDEKHFKLQKARKTSYPIATKMDRRIQLYENDLKHEWNKAREKLLKIKKAIKFFAKMDYSNTKTIDEIAVMPPKYKAQFTELCNKYDIDLSMLDMLVLNSSLLVNARYDHKKNLIELNPDYLVQHGMIRVGDSGELISEVDKTFIHEIGHAFYYQKLSQEQRMHWETLSKFYRREDLTGDMTQYLVGEKKRFDGSTMYSPYYTMRDDKFISVYARFNRREDFAECYLYYKLAPSTLKRINPDKFQFMDDAIGAKIEKKTITKAIDDETFQPEVEHPKIVRDKIIAILLLMNDNLSSTAKEHYQEAFKLGMMKGAYYSDKDLFDTSKLTQQEQDALQRLYQSNDGYLDGFIDDLLDDFDEVLFNKDAFGNVESIKPYEDADTFDETFDGVMESQEHRLNLYAVTGASLAMMAGLEMVSDAVGGYWHTTSDDMVCDGCNELNGQWMTYREFFDIYGKTECDGNCRCGDLFEPADAPFGPMEMMLKSGQNAYAQTGVGGSTVRETQNPKDLLRANDKCPKCNCELHLGTCPLCNFHKSDKLVAVDFHGTIKSHKGGLLPGIKEKLQEMRSVGYHIVVWTSGINKNPSIMTGVHTFLEENAVPYDEVWARQGKPDADIYIDDKSFNPTKENIKDLEV